MNLLTKIDRIISIYTIIVSILHNTLRIYFIIDQVKKQMEKMSHLKKD